MRPEQKKQTAGVKVRVSVVCVMLVLAGLAMSAPAQSAPQAPQSILPSSFEGWKSTNSTPFSPPGGIAATAASDYGFSSGTQATYVSGSKQINVTLYEMKDASGAYGEYTLLRTPDMRQSKLADYSVASSGHALALIGNLVLDIHGQDLPKLEAQLKSLVGDVAPHAKEGALPALLDELPAKGIIPGSEHYILGQRLLNQYFPVQMGNAVGFENGAEAEVAKYRLNGRDVTLLAIDYPTPQSAHAHLVALAKQFNIVTDVTSAKTDSKSNAAGSQPDSKLPPLYENRTLTTLFFVADAKSPKEAAALLGHLDSGEVLTLNSPTFSLTQPNIGTIVVGTIIGTGLICLFALISGLAFGGVRVVVKAVLPGKVFDRSGGLDILQLGLSSKPIKSEDFYGSPGFR